LLGLALLWRTLLSLSLLVALVGLTLLTLGSLSLRLIALAALALPALLALPLAGGPIALSFTALFGFALLVLALRAVAAFLLFVPALRALVTALIFWLRLAGGLIPLLPLLAPLRLAALVLCSRPAVLRSPLHIAAVLLTVRAGGIALALRGAVRHVLG
jgi:hypothetical protein